MDINISNIIDNLWQWLVTNNNRPAIRDTTRVYSIKHDCYIESSVSDPLSFTIFELSDKGELLIDNVARLIDSKAGYFLFVNTEKKFMVMVTICHSLRHFDRSERSERSGEISFIPASCDPSIALGMTVRWT